MKNKDKPVRKKEEEKHRSNNKTEGFESNPTGPSKDITIKPTTSKDTQIDDTDDKANDIPNKEDKKRVRKRIYKNRKDNIDEQSSNGSANAFEGK